MKVISVFDTTISDYNLGNQIIMQGVEKHLKEIFPADFFYRLPYLEIAKPTIDCIKGSDLVFFGGTNSLSSRMEKYKQWGVTLRNSSQVKDVILMGMGWWQYQERESLYTRVLLGRVLTRRYSHSVRDSYTEAKLRGLGFDNVINTGCPSTWDLTPSHCETIRRTKGKNVLLTVTDYMKDLPLDTRLVELLQRKYDKVYAWIQGVGDKTYLDSLCRGRVELINPDLKSFDAALRELDADFVGTRLHAGIRALQHGVRAIIVAVDNRAIEINKDINVPIVLRHEMDKLSAMIDGEFETRITLPAEKIATWKKQFASVHA